MWDLRSSLKAVADPCLISHRGLNKFKYNLEQKASNGQYWASFHEPVISGTFGIESTISSDLAFFLSGSSPWKLLIELLLLPLGLGAVEVIAVLWFCLAFLLARFFSRQLIPDKLLVVLEAATGCWSKISWTGILVTCFLDWLGSLR